MNKQDFIAKIAPAAVADMIASGVLASITIAQAALESAWGASAPGNNLFGIKGNGTTQSTREFINGQWVTIQAGFRAYGSWLESIADHSKFLTVNSRYARAGFFDACKKGDYAAAAHALQAAGYATDPQYAAKLIATIEANELQKYDIKEDNYMLKKEDADKVIGLLGAIWDMMPDAASRDEVHRLANELRKASGQPEE